MALIDYTELENKIAQLEALLALKADKSQIPSGGESPYTDDIQAGLDAGYVNLKPDTYELDSDLFITRHGTTINLNGSTIRPSSNWNGKALFSMKPTSNGFLDGIKMFNGYLDMNGKPGSAISNLEGFTPGKDQRMRFGFYQNLDVTGNISGYPAFAFRHLENKNVFDHCEFDGVHTAGLYIEDDGSNAGNVTVRDCKFSSASSSVECKLLHIHAKNSPFNRANITGNHFFVRNATQADRRHTHGIYLDFQDKGGTYNNRGILIHHNTIEDVYKGVFVGGNKATNSGGRGIIIDHNHIETKNDRPTNYETGNALIHVGQNISANISNNFLMIKASQGQEFVAFQNDSELPVWFRFNDIRKRTAEGNLTIKPGMAIVENNTI